MIDKVKLMQEVDKIYNKIIRIRRDLHMHPELGTEEVRTSEVIRSNLNILGIDNKNIAGTGVIGTIYGVNPDGPTIGIRADMDALPIQDEKNKCFSSKVAGIMHACGHDAHTAILLGAAEVLNNLKMDLNGNIRLIFQPAEETIGGASRMIDEGALKNPEVKSVIGLHVEETIETGSIGIRYGQMNASSNSFQIIIKGLGAHGAYPHCGVDAIAISSYVVTALQSIVSRELNPLDSAVITIGVINGGNAPNIICEKVKLEGTLRTLDNNLKKIIMSRMEEIINGISQSMRGNYKFEIFEGYPCLINDNTMVDLLKNSASKYLSKECIIDLNKPSLGVEDFAYYGLKVPSVFYKLGCRNEEKGIIYPSHSSLFDIDEESMKIGVLIQCQLAMDFLSLYQ